MTGQEKASVILANARIQFPLSDSNTNTWIPTFVGMTGQKKASVILANAGIHSPLSDTNTDEWISIFPTEMPKVLRNDSENIITQTI